MRSFSSKKILSFGTLYSSPEHIFAVGKPFTLFSADGGHFQITNLVVEWDTFLNKVFCEDVAQCFNLISIFNVKESFI